MILVTTQGEEYLNPDMEIIIGADEDTVKDALETGGVELNVSVSTGLIKKCSGEEEAEDLLGAECHEASTASNYPGETNLHFGILVH